MPNYPHIGGALACCSPVYRRWQRDALIKSSKARFPPVLWTKAPRWNPNTALARDEMVLLQTRSLLVLVVPFAAAVAEHFDRDDGRRFLLSLLLAGLA